MGDFKELNDRVNNHERREIELNDSINRQEELIEVLRHAEERSAMLAAIVDSSDDAIISKNLQGIVTSWNLAAQRIFGYSADEMIGESIIKLIPEDRQGEEPQILAKLCAGERVDHFETKRITNNGEFVDVSLTISPVMDSSGKIIGVSKIAKNITLLKRAEEKSAILTAIIESTDDAIISKDLNGTITSWNTSAERIFGFLAEEMIGQSILKLIPVNRHNEEVLILNQLRKGERVNHFETKRLTKQGQLIDVSLTISPVKDTHGNIIGLSKIARDITYKKLEEQRKNDFIAIISHELKTPLTSMRAYIQLALARAKKQTDVVAENVLIRAELQTRKMTTMIRDFLNLSRLEEGKMTLNMSGFSLLALMNEIVAEWRILAPDHVIDLQSCPDLELYADNDKIGQVMTNLLSNAIKYSKSGTSIKISCNVNDDDQVEICFSDQGVGITPTDQQRLFERFYRVKDGQIKNVSGFGIGLYLVAEILRLHGSEIKVQSEPGKGSVFSFTLPIPR